MQMDIVVTSFERPQYRLFPEHDDVESKLPNRPMATVLRRCRDIGRLQLDYARVASATRSSVRMPHQQNARLCNRQLRQAMWMCVKAERGGDRGQSSIAQRA
jgi:hypothetical protein